jgi:hypothetical protein
VTYQDNVRLVGELVTITGAVIILLLEVRCKEVQAKTVHLRPQTNSQTNIVFCFSTLFPDPRHFQSWCVSVFWTDSPWGAISCHHVSAF